MDYVDFVEKNRSKWKDYEWLHQFDRDAKGVSMTPAKFMGMKLKYGMEEVDCGISGERRMRQLLKTNILKDKLDPSVFNREITPDEYNDVLNYFAWISCDTLSMRVMEGRSELIPRQEYEFTSFTRVFLRNSEIFKLAVLKCGWEKIARRMFALRKELGGANEQFSENCWTAISLPIFGDIALQHLNMIEPDDPAIIEKKKSFLYMGLFRSFIMSGGDGNVGGGKRRYVWDKEPEVVDFVMKHIKAVDAKKLDLFTKFYAAAQLLSLTTYFDNRSCLGASGPFIVEDGKPMVVSTCMINEPVYFWKGIYERRDMPFSFIFCFILNPEKVPFKEFRINDIGTIFTSPPNFMDAIEKVAIFRRLEPEGEEPLPLEKLEEVGWSEVGDLINKCNECIIEWYDMVSAMPKREKILEGYNVYTWAPGSNANFLRPLGIWDYVRDNLDFWEMPPMTSEAYYMANGKVVTEVVPIQIFTGAGWTDFTDKAAPTSKYRAYLKRLRETTGWVSDLSGQSPIPDDIKAHVDEDGILQVPMQMKFDPNWLK